jgi:Xaa-Pro aminopeptidase
VLPHEREPVLVVALTYRVKSWIERTSRVAEVIHSPRVGLDAARLIAGWKADAAVGIADRDGLAAGIVDDLREGGSRLALRDATALFAALRMQADPAEIALAATAASIARRALEAASGRGARLGDMIAAAEGEARRLGAEEVYIAAAPDLARDCRLIRIEGETVLGESFALRATVAYKGTWIRLMRTWWRDNAATADGEAAARLAAAVAELPSTRGFASLSSWLVEGCRIAQPLAPLLGSRVSEPHPPAPRALVSVQAAFEVDGRRVLLGAPALVGGRGEASSLLVTPF